MAKMKPEVRKQEVLQAAVEVSEKYGFDGITRERVAAQAGVAVGTVNLHYGTMKQLRRAVARYAVHHELLNILAPLSVRQDYRHLITGPLRAKVAEFIAQG